MTTESTSQPVVLTQTDVAKLAALAAIRVSDELLAAMTADFEVILNAVTTLEQVDTAGVKPMSHPVPLTNQFRPDEVLPSLPVEVALKQAAAVEDNQFSVSQILGEE